jgi:purine-nucleoside phosphorylase
VPVATWPWKWRLPGCFGVAASEGVAAAALLTVSDHLNGDTHLSAQERQVGFSAMAEVALDAVTV